MKLLPLDWYIFAAVSFIFTVKQFRTLWFWNRRHDALSKRR